MTGEHDYDGWSARVCAAYHVPPINAFRTLILGLDGSNAVAVKVFPDGALLVTPGGGGGSGGNVTVTGFLPTINALVTVTGFLPSVTGVVTASQGLGGTSAWLVDATIQSKEAIYASHVSQGINLTHTSTWTVAISTPTTRWHIIKFKQTTDTEILVSYDGGSTTHDTVPSGDGFVLDLKANALHESSWISIKNDGSAAPARGKVYVQAVGV